MIENVTLNAVWKASAYIQSVASSAHVRVLKLIFWPKISLLLSFRRMNLMKIDEVMFCTGIQ